MRLITAWRVSVAAEATLMYIIYALNPVTVHSHGYGPWAFVRPWLSMETPQCSFPASLIRRQLESDRNREENAATVLCVGWVVWVVLAMVFGILPSAPLIVRAMEALPGLGLHAKVEEDVLERGMAHAPPEPWHRVDEGLFADLGLPGMHLFGFTYERMRSSSERCSSIDDPALGPQQLAELWQTD